MTQIVPIVDDRIPVTPIVDDRDNGTTIPTPQDLTAPIIIDDRTTNKPHSELRQMIEESKAIREHEKDSDDLTFFKDQGNINMIRDSLTGGVINSGAAFVKGVGWMLNNTSTGKPLGKFAESMEKHAQGFIPENPGLVSKVAQAIGSTGLYFLPGLGIVRGVSKIAKLSQEVARWTGAGSSAAIEATAEAGDVYSTVLKRTGSKEKADAAATKAFWVNTALLTVTNRYGLHGDIKNKLVRYLGSRLMEGGQESTQELVNQWTKEEKIDLGKIASAGGIATIASLPFGGARAQQGIQQEQVTVDNALDAILNNQVIGLLDTVKPTSTTAAQGVNRNIKKSSGGTIDQIKIDDDGSMTFDSTKKNKRLNQKRLEVLMQRYPNWKKTYEMYQKEDGMTFPTRLLNVVNQFDEKFLDRISGIKKVSPSTWKMALVYKSHKDVAVSEFKELDEVFFPVRNHEAIITNYLLANRIKSRAEIGIKSEDTPVQQKVYDKVLAKTKNKHKARKASLRAAAIMNGRRAMRTIAENEHIWTSLGNDIKQLENVKDGFHQWTHDKILEPLYKEGIINEKSYESAKDRNSFYMTFDILDRTPENVDSMNVSTGKEYWSVTQQKEFRGLTEAGTGKKIIDPLEATVGKFLQVKELIARNKIAKNFVNDKEASRLLQFSRVATSRKQYHVFREEAKKSREPGSNVRELQDPVMEDKWAPRKFDTISFYENGIGNKFIVERGFAESMKRLSVWQAPKVVHAVTNTFRKSVTTWFPPFMVTNFMRDSFMAYNTAPVYGANPVDMARFVADMAWASKEAVKHELYLGSKDVATYLKEGGGFGWSELTRSQKAAKKWLFRRVRLGKQQVIDHPAKLYQILETSSAIIELIPRMAVYHRAIKIGHSPQDAVLFAKAATIDFNKGGIWMKYMNQFVPFINARSQSVDIVASAIVKDPKKTLPKMFMSTVMPALAMYFWNRLYFSDLYDDIPEDVRSNYFNIIIGSGKDVRGRTVPKMISIPKGTVGMLAWNGFEAMLDFALKRNAKDMIGMAISYLSDLSPVEFESEGKLDFGKFIMGFAPPGLKGELENIANKKTYQGTEVVPHYMLKERAPEEQTQEWTPEIYNKLGRITKISPLRLENLITSFLGGYGRVGFNPISLLDALVGRIYKVRGGRIEKRALISIREMDYNYSKTLRLVEGLTEAGERRGATLLQRQWNKSVPNMIKDFNKEYERYGIKDVSGLRRKYTITVQKRKNIYKKLYQRKTPTSSLQRRLR